MFSLWSKTQKSTLRRAAGDSVTSRTENLATRHCIKPASDATCLPKLTTTFSLVTHLSPELNYVARIGLLQRMSPILARNRHADAVAACPLLLEGRTDMPFRLSRF